MNKEVTKKRLSASQIYAIQYLKKNGKVFVSFNSHLHKATVDFLLKYKIVMKVVGQVGYIELTDFGKTFEL